MHDVAVVDVAERLGGVEANGQDRVDRDRQPPAAGGFQHILHRPRHTLHEQYVEALWGQVHVLPVPDDAVVAEAGQVAELIVESFQCRVVP